MTDRHRTCDGAIATRFRLVLFLFGSLAAALITHVAIDMLGDVLLAHDAYDDLAHSSRQTGALAIGIALSVTLLFAIRAAFREARGNEGVLLALLRHAVPRCVWRYSAAVTGISLAFVAAMEACDALAAGLPTGDIVALLGGSLLLAVAVATCVAALVTIAVRIVLVRLTKLHGVIVAIVAAFIRIAISGRARSQYDRRNGHTCQARIGLRGRTAGERAPPSLFRSSFS